MGANPFLLQATREFHHYFVPPRGGGMEIKMKKALKVIGIILASLALIFGIFAVVNQIVEKQMNKYIDTFSAVEVEEQLVPTLEDGEYYFTTDREFRVMQLTDVHIGGGFLSIQEDKKAINAVAAMITEEKPDLVIVTGDISFAVPYISGTINNAIAHRMFMRLMERLEIPWTVVFGNHDSEAYNYYNRATVSKMYDDESLKHCLFIPDGDLSGEGNHVINVKNSAGLITESFYMIDTHSYTDQDPLGIKWDYDYVKEDQIAWYADKIEAHKAANAAVYATLTEEQKTAYAALLEPKSLMFMHIPLREVKAAYDESIANGKEDTENVKWKEGFDGETDEVVYCSRTDEQLFETVLEKGSTKALFYGHDHLNNFVLEYKGVTLSYGYSIDYLAYSGIDEQGYHRGCTIITCEPSGDATIMHENYYQDKYVSQYEKEIVNMEPYKAE